MKWLIGFIISMVVTFPVQATTLAHTGAPCQTYQSLKKEHPSQHIYYETVEGKRCYHVHASHQTESSANSQTTPWAVSMPQRMSKTKDVLEYFSIPTMRAFSDDYTRGRNF